MPRNTINSLTEQAISSYSVAEQQRMFDAGLIRETLSTLSIPGTPILEGAADEDDFNPWSGRDLNELDLDKPILESMVDETRFKIEIIVLRFARVKKLKSAA